MEARIKRVVISITPSEKKILRQLAEYEGGLSMTATIRHILLEAARQRELCLSQQNKEGIDGRESREPNVLSTVENKT